MQEWAELQTAPVYLTAPKAPRALPVVLVGGFGAPAYSMRPLARWLAKLGHGPHVSCWRAGLGCGERSVVELARALEKAAPRDPVVIVAHSRGGQFGRVLAARAPERVAGLITLGTPFRHLAVQGTAVAHVAALCAVGTLGAPGLVGLSCLCGSCCARFRRDLAGPWPHEIPFVAVRSRHDRTVIPSACVDRAARNVEVAGTHVGMISSSATYSVIAETLAEIALARG